MEGPPLALPVSFWAFPEAALLEKGFVSRSLRRFRSRVDDSALPATVMVVLFVAMLLRWIQFCHGSTDALPEQDSPGVERLEGTLRGANFEEGCVHAGHHTIAKSDGGAFNSPVVSVSARRQVSSAAAAT